MYFLFNFLFCCSFLEKYEKIKRHLLKNISAQKIDLVFKKLSRRSVKNNEKKLITLIKAVEIYDLQKMANIKSIIINDMLMMLPYIVNVNYGLIEQFKELNNSNISADDYEKLRRRK